mgnify:CR=1 FL=1
MDLSSKKKTEICTYFFLSVDGDSHFEADFEGVVPPLDFAFGVLLKNDKIDFCFFSLIINDHKF